MKSVLKKFEKNSIDMSKIYGQGDIGTGRARTATSGGAVLSGMEYIRIHCCPVNRNIFNHQHLTAS